MTWALFVMWVVVGLVSGWLAGFALKGGQYGLIWDLILGLAGGSAALVILWILGGMSPWAEPFITALVAFVGAVLVMVAQRKVWDAEAETAGPAHPGQEARGRHLSIRVLTRRR